MTTMTHTSQQGMKLIGTEIGAWMDTTDSVSDYSADGTKDLTENGTLIQSDVAVGAGFFQYTGFSATDYLHRAYDSDFDLLGDPATDGHTLMAWVNVGTVTDIETIIDRQDTGGTGARYNMRLNADGTVGVVVSDGTNTRTVDSLTDLNNAGWTFIVATWDSVGTQNIYINGALDTTDALGTSVGSLVNGTAVFRIGLSATGTDACAQGITLCKVFAHEATALQVKSVFDSENKIFKINSTYVSFNEPVTFTFPASRLNRGENAIRSVNDSIGGKRQVIFDRADITWDITSSEIYGADVLSFQTMLSAALRGYVLTLDPYDLGEPVNCVIDSGSYTANRIETSEYFTFSFKVKTI